LPFIGTLRRLPPSSKESSIMGKLIFLYRSLAYRNAAAEMLRKARALPPGSEQRAARRYAMALRDLERTEAWLEGRRSEEPLHLHRARTRENAPGRERRTTAG
jgi:hypothetical protein